MAKGGLDDRSAGDLDDEDDREELRARYYGLLQELRVLLPGVQILLAFLLTAPFANRFGDLDATGRDLYGVALGSSLVAVIAFTSPTVFHRVAPRRRRSHRLIWGIRMTRLGLVMLAIALTSGLLLVCRLVFGDTIAIVSGLGVVAALAGAWVVLPVLAGRPDRQR